MADLEGTFKSVSKLSALGVNMNLQPFKIRRERLQQILRLRIDPPSRVNCGLLDIGGTILHHLFGVATESQLARYKATMAELKRRQEDIAHAYGTLATVVNQTRTYVKQLAIQQRHRHDQVIKLDTAIITLGQAVHTYSKKLHQVALLTDLYPIL